MPENSVLFIDLDDVLIVPTLYKIKHRRRVKDGRKVHYAFSPAALKSLRQITTECPTAALVISSTWRLEGRREVEMVFRLNGCPELLVRFHDDWATRELRPDGNRADEISDWLMRHPEITHAAAIDNNESILGKRWAVLVMPSKGLSDTDAFAAIKLMKNDPGAL